LPAAAGDLLGEGRPDRQQAGAELGCHDDPLRAADEVVVLDEPRVDRVLLSDAKADAMAPPYLVDEEDDFTLGHGFIRAPTRPSAGLPSKWGGEVSHWSWAYSNPHPAFGRPPQRVGRRN